MKLSPAGLDLIKKFEGYLDKQPDGSCKAYKCPAGVWTCGWGCTEGVTMNTHWTKDEATERLATEMAKHEAAVLRLVKVPISQSQFDALVSFSYNVGSGALAKSTLLKHLNAGDAARAASHFADWKRAGGKVLPGLVRRRAAEAEMFMADMPIAMPQKVDVASSKLKPKEAMAKIAAPAAAVGGAIASVDPAAVTTQVAAWQGLGKTLTEAATMVGSMGKVGVAVAIGCGVVVVTKMIVGRAA